MSEQTADASLLELLRNVPKDGRTWYEHGWCHHQNIPYGNLCNDAANRIILLESALRNFCQRVERGEIKSARTYKKFKELLGEAMI